MYPPYWFRLVKKVHIIPPEMAFFCYLSVIFQNLIQLIKKYVILTKVSAEYHSAYIYYIMVSGIKLQEVVRVCTIRLVNCLT